jgi:hypothetical protein
VPLLLLLQLRLLAHVGQEHEVQGAPPDVCIFTEAITSQLHANEKASRLWE